MSFQELPLSPGLYLVATPIGSARDITLRALDVLASADVLAAEDTRTLRRLMGIHGVPVAGRPLVAYHDHSPPRARTRLLGELGAGRSVAYASEAGTPLLADPGFALVRAAIAGDHPVTAAPGPSAAVAALTLSGLPSDRFLFAGFPPASGGARRDALHGLAAIEATVVLYESPKRVSRLLSEIASIFGEARPVAICREMTKRFEEVRRGAAATLAEETAGETIKGEVVLVIGPAEAGPGAGEEEMEAALRAAMRTESLKDAVGRVAGELGLPRRRVYQAALALERGE